MCYTFCAHCLQHLPLHFHRSEVVGSLMCRDNSTHLLRASSALHQPVYQPPPESDLTVFPSLKIVTVVRNDAQGKGLLCPRPSYHNNKRRSLSHGLRNEPEDGALVLVHLQTSTGPRDRYNKEESRSVLHFLHIMLKYKAKLLGANLCGNLPTLL